MRSEWIVSVDDKGNSEIGVIESAKWEQELIRCKDCRYWLPMNRFHEDYHPGHGECELNCWLRDDNWFCADGEQKDSE